MKKVMKVELRMSVVAQIFEHLKNLEISIFEVKEKHKYGFIFTNSTYEILFGLAPFASSVRNAVGVVEEVLRTIQQTTQKTNGSEVLNSDLIISISRELRQHRVAKINEMR